MNNTAQHLRQWRDNLGLSQPDMAALLGAPVCTYIKWEQGSRVPNTIARSGFALLQWLHYQFPDVFERIRAVRVSRSKRDEKGGSKWDEKGGSKWDEKGGSKWDEKGGTL